MQKNNLITKVLRKLSKTEQNKNSADIDIIPNIKKILTFPEARQATDFTCGAASVQSILYYYGIDKREEQIVEKMQVKPTNTIHSGVDPDIMVESLEHTWGLNVAMKQNMTIPELTAYIDNDIPVILAIQAWNDSYDTENGVHDYSKSYKDGHYVVAIGYTSDDIMIFEDPSIMSNRGYMSFKELETRWHDKDYKGDVFKNLGIAVFGKKPQFNPTFAKKIL